MSAGAHGFLELQTNPQAVRAGAERGWVRFDNRNRGKERCQSGKHPKGSRKRAQRRTAPPPPRLPALWQRNRPGRSGRSPRHRDGAIDGARDRPRRSSQPATTTPESRRVPKSACGERWKVFVPVARCCLQSSTHSPSAQVGSGLRPAQPKACPYASAKAF